MAMAVDSTTWLLSDDLATGGPSGWTPPSLPGLVGWWDMSDMSSLTHSGATTSQAADKSGAGNHMQTSGTKQPTIDEVNGLSALSFDGVDDVMSSTLPTNATDNFAMWLVCQPRSSGPAYTPFAIGAEGANGYGISVAAGAGKVAGVLKAGVAWVDSTTATPMAAPSLHYFARISGTWQHRVDGVATDLTGRTDTFSTPTTMALLGANGLTPGAYTAPFHGLICEAWIVNEAILPADRTAAEAYARAKWGTA